MKKKALIILFSLTTVCGLKSIAQKETKENSLGLGIEVASRT
jgi:hypothetical protein